MDLFRKESLASYMKTDGQMPKTMNAGDLMAMGIGAVIGSGIFILPGTVAANDAGPGVTLSFLAAAVVCGLAGMCYAEFSSASPVAGSAYSYGNIIYGEFIGWIMGWALVLEYLLAVACVSTGWAAYFNSLLASCGVNIPKSLSGPFNPAGGTYINLTAILSVLLITWLLSYGMHESVRVNNIAIVVKLLIIVAFIVIGIFFVKKANYHPFLPYGAHGAFKGATTVFFAFLGFDCISSSAAEVKHPQKNMPIGIIGTLLIATVLYMGVSLVLTGMVNYKHLDVANPVAFALQSVHQGWLASLLSIGALIGMATCMFTAIYASSRLIYSLSRDGLLPTSLHQLDKKSHTPKIALWAVAIVIAIMGGFVSLDSLTNLVNIGTLLAFTMVSFGIIPLRKRADILNEGGFKVPLYPVLPLLSGFACLFMMSFLSKETWIGAGIWFVIGMVLYFGYGYRHSNINNSITLQA